MNLKFPDGGVRPWRFCEQRSPLKTVYQHEYEGHLDWPPTIWLTTLVSIHSHRQGLVGMPLHLNDESHCTSFPSKPMCQHTCCHAYCGATKVRFRLTQIQQEDSYMSFKLGPLLSLDSCTGVPVSSAALRHVEFKAGWVRPCTHGQGK